MVLAPPHLHRDLACREPQLGDSGLMINFAKMVDVHQYTGQQGVRRGTGQGRVGLGLGWAELEITD